MPCSMRIRRRSSSISAGRKKVLGFFVGQVMKRSGGKANPRQANETLRERLARRRDEPPAGQTP